VDLEELLRLPPLVDVPTAARVLGIGRALAYDLIRSGAWPTNVIRLGKVIRVPTAALVRLTEQSDERRESQLTVSSTDRHEVAGRR